MLGDLDLELMHYNTYAEYLDSLISKDDYCYIGSIKNARQLVKLGFDKTRVYEKHEFLEIKSKIAKQLLPKVTSHLLFGHDYDGDDEALEALAQREEANSLYRIAILLSQTIVYLQVRQQNGFDISGYIDYEESLRNSMQRKPNHIDWKAVFKGRILLRPRPTDLSYYNWRTGKVFHGDSDNWKCIMGLGGLMFMHKSDHRYVPVTDKPSKYSDNVKRFMIRSKLYGYMTLYDHVIR
ncbi:hypothetical protein KR222_009757 [Zaprionus bogoriensis]|nr:hypothetical protein KR222_009757 [Zaprionus bogoriensis]